MKYQVEKETRIIRCIQNDDYNLEADLLTLPPDLIGFYEVKQSDYLFKIGDVFDLNDSKIFDYLKNKKLAELQAAINEKEYFSTPFGNLGLNTIAGTLSTVLANYLMLNLPDYTGMLFTFEGETIPNLTNEVFKELYQKALRSYQMFDRDARTIRKAIQSAETLEALNSIVIDFSYI